ncbi:hypothetical protein MRX96_037707 [Rhipicephalus microplus]
MRKFGETVSRVRGRLPAQPAAGLAIHGGVTTLKMPAQRDLAATQAAASQSSAPRQTPPPSYLRVFQNPLSARRGLYSLRAVVLAARLSYSGQLPARDGRRDIQVAAAVFINSTGHCTRRRLVVRML